MMPPLPPCLHAGRRDRSPCNSALFRFVRLRTSFLIYWLLQHRRRPSQVLSPPQPTEFRKNLEHVDLLVGPRILPFVVVLLVADSLTSGTWVTDVTAVARGIYHKYFILLILMFYGAVYWRKLNHQEKRKQKQEHWCCKTQPKLYS